MQIDTEGTQLDFVNPAQRIASGGSTSVASLLLNNDMDVNALRPYIATSGPYAGRPVMTTNAGYDPKTRRPKKREILTNDATLRYDDWKLIDESVIRVAKPRLNMVKDLVSRGLVYDLPGGMSKTLIQQQQMSDITPATISMDALRESESDRPVFSTFNFPLPIVHKDFQFPLRQVLESRTGNTPLDTTTAELAARRVAEAIEQLVLGTTSSLLTGAASYSYGGATVYGYMNHPNRITYSITLPTAGGWTPATTIANILAMMALSRAANHFGPWVIYLGQAWAPYLDDDYKPTYNDTTLRDRISKIGGVSAVVNADYLPGYSILMVEMDSQTVRLVRGMDVRTVQWESHGGFQLNFKVLALMVPQIRYDQAGTTGIIHGS